MIRAVPTSWRTISQRQRTQEDHRGKDSEGTQVTRRGFLVWLARGSLATAAAVAIGQVVRFLSFRPRDGTATNLPVGQLTDFPYGALTYVAAAQAYVGRDEGGLYAQDAVCTHLGCLVEHSEKGGFTCPCHGSKFDAAGEPSAGPAKKPLPYLKLWLEQDGQVMLDRLQTVEPSTRLTA